MQTGQVTRRVPGRFTAVALATIVLGVFGPALALVQDARMEDLRQAPPSRQVAGVLYCGGRYSVSLKDGSTREFGERDLRFGTDAGPLGPPAGRPVLVAAGRVGDRAIVIFAAPSEMPGAVRSAC